ncbi:SRPBCC family protein [Chitinophaga qingshengii]|uniref:SRPBCC domain-containing protein n=1 Tax=Chitinophaga qingshengii TaxID=1569794 RepID=A0ABR7TQX7_9BACT|nr:SRPBCC domain-containing protein [Chitinophaga qingshengii]MBC9932035.1 SRPBCC domain-containing protein [Chitinophaga qingshengii]
MKKVTDKRVFVQVEKAFEASAEKVFDAWLDIELLSHWMFGPAVRNEEILNLTNDPRPGGRFSYQVKRGNDILNHIGNYLEVKRPSLLVFTWGVDQEPGDESVVTIRITPTATGCLLQLEHDMDGKWAAYADRTEEGWTYMTGLLYDYLQR